MAKPDPYFAELARRAAESAFEAVHTRRNADPAYTPPEVPRVAADRARTGREHRAALDEIRAIVFDAAMGALCQRADVLKRVQCRFHASSVAASAADAARAYLEKA